MSVKFELICTVYIAKFCMQYTHVLHLYEWYVFKLWLIGNELVRTALHLTDNHRLHYTTYLGMQKRLSH